MASLTPRLDKLDRNRILNADMRISQRNTSFAAVANGQYTLDRYVYYKVGAMVHTISQDTDAPTLGQSDYLFQNSLRMNLTTPDTAIAAGDVCAITQKVEGYNWAPLAQKAFTLSFWVKATLPGIYCVAFQNSTNDRSYVAEYTINSTNTWEKKTINVAASPSAGTWNYANGIGLEVNWTIAAGSNFQQTPGSWQANAGAKYATSNQVNGVNTGATDFKLTGIMLVGGTISDPSFGTYANGFEGELEACQRYYEKSYNYTVTPGTATNVGFVYGGYTGAASFGTIAFIYKTSKRANPTHTTRDGSGNSGVVSGFNAGSAAQTNGIAITNALVSEKCTSLYISNSLGVVAWFGGQFTADAEL